MENNLRYQFKLFDGTGKRMFWKMGCYPELVNKVCPHCGAHPMLERDIYHVISEYETNYQCPLCGNSFKPEEVLGVSNDDLTVDQFLFDGERYNPLEEENLSSVAAGLRNAKDKKVRILVDDEPQTYTQCSCGSDFPMFRLDTNIEDSVVVATTPPTPIEEPVQLFTALNRIEDLAQDINIFTFKPLIDELTTLPLLLTNVDIDPATAAKIKGRLLGLYSKIDVGQTKWKRQSDRDYHEGYFDAIFNIIALMLA